MARLVLLKKPDRAPSSYRPICLLNEAGKLLERIICNRLTQYLDESGGISESQLGFRSQRSTVDAIWKLRAMMDDGVRHGGGVMLAVSFDIANAFNSLPDGLSSETR